MSHRARFKVYQEAVSLPLARNHHRIGPPSAAPQTYAQTLQAEAKRRAEADVAEALRLAQVLAARAETDVRLRAASMQRVKDKEAQAIARREAKAKHRRDYAAAMLVTEQAFAQGLEEALLNGFFREAYEKIAGQPY